MQLVWSMLLAAHLAAAGVWLWLMPGGFPADTTAYWVNQVAPWIVIAWAVVALVGRGLKIAVFVAPLRLGLAAFWIAFGVSARIAFPISSGALWGLALGGGLGLVIAWLREHGVRPERRWLVPLFVVPALWAGWRAPLSQRAVDPTTHPLATALPTAPTGGADTKVVRLSKSAQLRPGEARLVVKRDDHILTVQPLLVIESRSPDRGPASLAPPDEFPPPPRKLAALGRDGTRWRLAYRDQPATLEATATDSAIELDAHTEVPRDVYTHVNTYAELTLRGHQRLALRFSPLPTLKVDVPAFTARQRFAYVDAAGIFHVAEAHQHDTGPFVELGAGKLAPGEPLVIQLYDGDTLVFTIRLDDWAKQASTALSPTAGWGVPANAIQFMRSAEPLSAPVLISATLAATGLGRGTQTVGLGAGVYRNRMRIEVR